MTGVYFHTWREKVSFSPFRVILGDADCVVVDGLDRGDGGVGGGVSLVAEDAAGVYWRSGRLDLDGRRRDGIYIRFFCYFLRCVWLTSFYCGVGT